jgi:putative aldouronate transport system substrate-binding protein
MKKRNLGLFGVATVAALSLGSCQPQKTTTSGGVNIKSYYTYAEAPKDEVYDTDGGRLDVSVNYSNTDGISFRKEDSFLNSVDKKTYKKDDVLPTWKAFAEKTKTTICEASDYKGKETVDAPILENDDFKSQKDKNQQIDVLYQKTNQINTWGSANKMIKLDEHLDDMPNFKKYLEKNKFVKKDITSPDGHIYYTPYFDSYNDVERCLIMDTSLVEKVVDATSFDNFDTTNNGGSNPAVNVVQKGSYTPFICANNNYPAATTVKVSVNGEAKDMTIKQTGYNIIAEQNKLLQAGTTGKALAKQFKDYLVAAFGDNVGEGKVYSKYSEIFTAQQAAYNTDELIALMRVVKANPGVISGDANAEVETLQPRGEDNSRIQNILQFAQIWGVQGLVSEKDFLYYTNDGKLNDARSTKASYQVLQNLAAIYEEGLIVTDFWYKGASQNKNLWLQKNYQKTLDNWGYGLLEYDYVATQVVANDVYEGVGTASNKRKGAAQNLKVTGIKPILAPLSYWGTGKVSVDADLTDFSQKTLMRHYDENRSTKDTGFCIPSNTDNLKGALRLVDYVWSDMGRLIQDYGPQEYWNKPVVEAGKDSLAAGLTYDASKAYVATDYIDGELVPILSAAVKQMWANSGNDYWSFMRGYIGSTHGIGHERSKSIQLQCCNYYGQKGLADLETTFANGVCDVSLNNKDGDDNDATVTWNTSVPTTNYNEPDTTVSNEHYAAIVAFWNNSKYNALPLGWVYVVQAGKGADISGATLGSANSKNYTYADVQSQQNDFNKFYVYAMANSLSKDGAFVPDYAKSTN